MERMQKHSTLEEKLKNGVEHLENTQRALWLALFEHSSKIIKDRGAFPLFLTKKNAYVILTSHYRAQKSRSV